MSHFTLILSLIGRLLLPSNWLQQHACDLQLSRIDSERKDFDGTDGHGRSVGTRVDQLASDRVQPLANHISNAFRFGARAFPTTRGTIKHRLPQQELHRGLPLGALHARARHQL